MKEDKQLIKKYLSMLRLEYILEKLEKLSLKQKLVVLVLIWCLIFIPSIIDHSYLQRNDHYQFYPNAGGPDNYRNPGWNITTYPVNIDNTTENGLLSIEVKKGEEVRFEWIWNKDPSQGAHVGTVDVLIRSSNDDWELIRLRRTNNTSEKEVWSKEIGFNEDKKIEYYYRVGQTDIPTYDRRASIILDGKNPYEETRTGPPPLIHFFFMPPTLLTAPMSLGGAFLSFNIYFSLFVLLDSLLIFYGIKKIDESKAYLASIIFILNPITILTVHQDEPIIVFMMILPLFLLMRNRRFISSLSVGFGAVAKIWTAFWIPVLMISKGLRKIRYIGVVFLSGLSVFLLFILMWGEKVLWFLTFYGGTADKQNIGGISFWNFGMKMLGIDGNVLPTTLVLIGIALMELFVWWLAWKKEWRPISTIVSFFVVFLALYPKIHWEYILLLLPFLSILASERSVFLKLFYAITVISAVTMFLGRLDKGLMFLPFIFSVLLSLLFFYVLIKIYKEAGKISDIRFD
ncbi:MAG: glycosyltransferase family 87 protein [Thermoplasmatota archaeon]